jgi:hypothetical protein
MEVYVFTPDGAEWEDLVIYLSREEAIEKSKTKQNVRVDVYTKSADGYRPSYNYFLNGTLIDCLVNF